jgi:hypothetical protein
MSGAGGVLRRTSLQVPGELPPAAEYGAGDSICREHIYRVIVPLSCSLERASFNRTPEPDHVQLAVRGAPISSTNPQRVFEKSRTLRKGYLTETSQFSDANSELGRSVRATKWYQPIPAYVLSAAFDA